MVYIPIIYAADNIVMWRYVHEHLENVTICIIKYLALTEKNMVNYIY